MFTIAQRVGRLCEIRYGELRVEDMSLYRARFAALLQEAHGKLVFVSDVRACESVSSAVEEQGVQLMRAATPRVERAAMLVSPRTMFGMQLLRATLSTDSRVRRVFHDPAEVELWLGDLLVDAERDRLRAFLAEPRLAD